MALSSTQKSAYNTSSANFQHSKTSLHESISPVGGSVYHHLPRLNDNGDFFRRSSTKIPKCQTPGESSVFSNDDHNIIVNMLSPNPLPYQAKSFKPSTVTKLVDVPRRHHESFAYPHEAMIQRQKGIIIHSDRYSWTEEKYAEKLCQRERMRAELQQVERARGKKRRRHVVGHRTKHELLLGGERLDPPEQPQVSEDHIHDLPHHRPIPLHPSFDPQVYLEPGKYTFQGTNTVTVSMDVHKARIHGRDDYGDGLPPAPAPAPTRRPPEQSFTSQVPHLPRIPFPYIPSMASSVWDPDEVAQQHQDERARGGVADFILGGNGATFTERADIMSELRFLKSMILPEAARELYVGRGIRLPSNHATMKPRSFIGSVVVPNASVAQEQKQSTVQEIKVGGIDLVLTAKTPDHEKDNVSGTLVPEEPQTTSADGQPQTTSADGQPQTTYLTQDPNEETADLQNTTENIPGVEDGVEGIGEVVKHEDTTQEEEPAPNVSEEMKEDDQNVVTNNELMDQNESLIQSSSLFKNTNITADRLALNIEDIEDKINLLVVSEKSLTLDKLLELTCDPEALPAEQLTYLDCIFRLVSTAADTKAFTTLLALQSRIESIGDPIKEFYSKLQDEDVSSSIELYINKFDDNNESQDGAMPWDVFRETLHPSLTDEQFTQFQSDISMTEADHIDKLTYIACLPYLINLQ